MELQTIKYRTAVLARKKGFIYTGNCYHVNEGYSKGYTFCYSNVAGGRAPNVVSAPYQEELQQWFRKTHGIKIVIDTDVNGLWEYSITSLSPEASYTGDYILSMNTYSTYEDALEKGLYESLELLPDE